MTMLSKDVRAGSTCLHLSGSDTTPDRIQDASWLQPIFVWLPRDPSYPSSNFESDRNKYKEKCLCAFALKGTPNHGARHGLVLAEFLICCYHPYLLLSVFCQKMTPSHIDNVGILHACLWRRTRAVSRPAASQASGRPREGRFSSPPRIQHYRRSPHAHARLPPEGGLGWKLKTTAKF